MDHQEARGLLEEVAQIQSATRARLHAVGWQWLVIWSIAFLGAALTALVPSWQRSAGVYWMFATPIALILTVVVSSRMEARSAVRQRSLPYWLVGLGIALASLAADLLVSEAALVVVVWVILGLGFAGFAWLERVEPAAWLLAGMAVLSGALGFVVEDTFALYPVLAMSFSAALAGVIVGMRIQAQR
jgi:hypothetical protein